jgi:putative transcriptional regulator
MRMERVLEPKLMNSLAGKFLVAAPNLADPNFFHTVVLIVQHDAEGALGLVLDQPSSLTVAEVWKENKLGNTDCDQPIYIGGPVSGPLMALHSRLDMCDVEVVPEVYFTTSRENVQRLVNIKHENFLLFVGYSGWGGGQLENEMEMGGWFISQPTAELVFGKKTEIWRQVTNQIGCEILSPGKPSSGYDVGLN